MVLKEILYFLLGLEFILCLSLGIIQELGQFIVLDFGLKTGLLVGLRLVVNNMKHILRSCVAENSMIWSIDWSKPWRNSRLSTFSISYSWGRGLPRSSGRRIYKYSSGAWFNTWS